MKKSVSLLLALLLCLLMASSVCGEGEAPALPPVSTASLLGTWEVNMPEYGLFTLCLGENGVGVFSQGGQAMGEFAFMAQGNVMVSVEDGEDGKPVVEQAQIEFVDENTIRSQEDGAEVVFKRVAPPEKPEVALDNPFLGKWEANIPSAGAVLDFEFCADGGFFVTVDGQRMGPFAYMVRGDGLYTFEEEVEIYTFAVRDADTIDVTEDGVTVPFVRAAQ